MPSKEDSKRAKKQKEVSYLMHEMIRSLVAVVS